MGTGRGNANGWALGSRCESRWRVARVLTGQSTSLVSTGCCVEFGIACSRALQARLVRQAASRPATARHRVSDTSRVEDARPKVCRHAPCASIESGQPQYMTAVSVGTPPERPGPSAEGAVCDRKLCSWRYSTTALGVASICCSATSASCVQGEHELMRFGQGEPVHDR